MKPLIGINCEFRPEEKCPLFSPPAYGRAVGLGGGLPVLLPILKDEKVADAPKPLWRRRDVKGVLSRLDGLVLSGGRDLDPAIYGEKKHPATRLISAERAHFDIMLAKGAIQQGLPILAICYGAQLVNVALGGTLIQHIPDEIPGALAHQPACLPAGRHGRRGREKGGEVFHSVRLKPQSKLARIIGTAEIEVNSSHHQAICQPGQGLVISAKAPDGVIEALEGEGERFLIAVQWHPERLTDRPEHLSLFKALVEISRQP